MLIEWGEWGEFESVLERWWEAEMEEEEESWRLYCARSSVRRF